MPTVHVHLWHTSEGQIVAIGRPAQGAKLKAVRIAGNDQSIFEADVDESDIKTLHQTHAVDYTLRKLVKRTS